MASTRAIAVAWAALAVSCALCVLVLPALALGEGASLTTAPREVLACFSLVCTIRPRGYA